MWRRDWNISADGISVSGSTLNPSVTNVTNVTNVCICLGPRAHCIFNVFRLPHWLSWPVNYHYQSYDSPHSSFPNPQSFRHADGKRYLWGEWDGVRILSEPTYQRTRKMQCQASAAVKGSMDEGRPQMDRLQTARLIIPLSGHRGSQNQQSGSWSFPHPFQKSSYEHLGSDWRVKAVLCNWLHFLAGGRTMLHLIIAERPVKNKRGLRFRIYSLGFRSKD